MEFSKSVVQLFSKFHRPSAAFSLRPRHNGRASVAPRHSRLCPSWIAALCYLPCVCTPHRCFPRP